MTDLKACPFCEGSFTVIITGENRWNYTHDNTMCPLWKSDEVALLATDHWTSAEGVAKALNERPLEAALQQQIATLIKRNQDLELRLDAYHGNLLDIDSPQIIILKRRIKELVAFVRKVAKETLITDGEYSYLNPYQPEAARLLEQEQK